MPGTPGNVTPDTRISGVERCDRYQMPGAVGSKMRIVGEQRFAVGRSFAGDHPVIARGEIFGIQADARERTLLIAASFVLAIRRATIPSIDDRRPRVPTVRVPQSVSRLSRTGRRRRASHDSSRSASLSLRQILQRGPQQIVLPGRAERVGEDLADDDRVGRPPLARACTAKP